MKILLGLFPEPPELDALGGRGPKLSHRADVKPAEADSGHQQPHNPHHAPPEHSSHVLLGWKAVGNTAECPHASRGVASDDVGVVTGEVERVDEEDSHQEDTHEEVWHGGGGEGGVEGEEGIVGSRQGAAVSLHS